MAGSLQASSSTSPGMDPSDDANNLHRLQPHSAAATEDICQLQLLHPGGDGAVRHQHQLPEERDGDLQQLGAAANVRHHHHPQESQVDERNLRPHLDHILQANEGHVGPPPLNQILQSDAAHLEPLHSQLFQSAEGGLGPPLIQVLLEETRKISTSSGRKSLFISILGGGGQCREIFTSEFFVSVKKSPRELD